MDTIPDPGICVTCFRSKIDSCICGHTRTRTVMRQLPLERDINIAVNGCSWFATSTQIGPFMAMLISRSRGTHLIHFIVYENCYGDAHPPTEHRKEPGSRFGEFCSCYGVLKGPAPRINVFEFRKSHCQQIEKPRCCLHMELRVKA